MSRYTPVTSKAEMESEYQHVFDQVMGVFGRVRGPFSMLLHSPKLRQIAVLTATRERDANYVWAAQVDVARRAGLRELVIDLLRTKGDPPDLPPEERDIVVYMRQLMRTNRVEQSVFDAMKERHGVPWLVELTAVANFYVALCGVVNAFDVPVPPEGDRFDS